MQITKQHNLVATILAGLISNQHSNGQSDKQFAKLVDDAYKYADLVANKQIREADVKTKTQQDNKNVENLHKSLVDTLETIAKETSPDVAWFDSTNPRARLYEPERIRLAGIGKQVLDLKRKL